MEGGPPAGGCTPIGGGPPIGGPPIGGGPPMGGPPIGGPPVGGGPIGGATPLGGGPTGGGPKPPLKHKLKSLNHVRTRMYTHVYIYICIYGKPTHILTNIRTECTLTTTTNLPYLFDIIQI